MIISNSVREMNLIFAAVPRPQDHEAASGRCRSSQAAAHKAVRLRHEEAQLCGRNEKLALRTTKQTISYCAQDSAHSKKKETCDDHQKQFDRFRGLARYLGRSFGAAGTRG
jgi:hypothetical protein